MAGKITDYPTTTTLIDEDLFDLSKYDGVSAYATNAIKWEDILKEIQIDLTFNNLYNNNGTIGTGRTATLTDSLSFVSGQVIAAASAAGYASLNIPSGVDPTVPVDGDLWFNGTNLYFRDGATSIDLLGGDGNGIFDAANNGSTVPTTYAFDIQNTLAIRGVSSVPIATFNTSSGLLIGGGGVNTSTLTVNTSNAAPFVMQRQGVDMLKVTYQSGHPTLRMFNSINGEVINLGGTGFAPYHTYFIAPGNFGIGTAAPTDKLQVIGTVDATRYKVNGVAGANFTGAVTNITVVDGLVTAVS
jgi:hypothetical protein